MKNRGITAPRSTSTPAGWTALRAQPACSDATIREGPPSQLSCLLLGRPQKKQRFRWNVRPPPPPPPKTKSANNNDTPKSAPMRMALIITLVARTGPPNRPQLALRRSKMPARRPPRPSSAQMGLIPPGAPQLTARCLPWQPRPRLHQPDQSVYFWKTPSKIYIYIYWFLRFLQCFQETSSGMAAKSIAIHPRTCTFHHRGLPVAH